MSESLPLHDKIAVVTGASRGIGRAAALALAKAGAQLVAVARTQGGLEELDDEVRAATGRSATLVPLEISDGDALDQLGFALHQRFGRLDILVHAAAILGPLTPVAHIEPKHWDRVVATNLTATYRLIRTTEPLLRAAPSARAIFLTTGRAQRPKAFWGPYGATKAGQLGFMRTACIELAKYGITVNAVMPGNIMTEGLQGLGEDYLEAMAASIPLKRLGTVDDIGHAAAFLASREAAYITGQTIVVDGGQVQPESLEALAAG